jgi:hypothetical protein
MEACTTKERLLLEWQEAANLYAELLAKCAAAPTADGELHKTATQVGQLADRLRADLEIHLNTHGCGP